MTTRTLPGTTLRLSAFCYGTAELGATVCGAAADRLINAFRDAGGNFLDTAHVYACWTDAGAGSSERAIAAYFRRNGGRNQMIVATKGGHMPFASYVHSERYPSAAAIADDIRDSLARLEAAVLDFYWLHRDDPRLPVAEIIETMNAEIRQGRIRYLGASNWQVARIAAANAYARARVLRRRHGRPGL